VKKKDRIEVVSMIGLFGLLVTIIEMYPFYLKIVYFTLHYVQSQHREIAMSIINDLTFSQTNLRKEEFGISQVVC